MIFIENLLHSDISPNRLLWLPNLCDARKRDFSKLREGLIFVGAEDAPSGNGLGIVAEYEYLSLREVRPVFIFR